MNAKRVTIKTDEGTVLELTRQGIFTRIFNAAYEIAVTPNLYEQGLSNIRRRMMDVVNQIYAGFERYGSSLSRFPSGWSRDFEELIGILIPILTTHDIANTGIQQREMSILALADEYKCRVETLYVIRLCTYLHPTWLTNATASFRRVSEIEVGKMLSRGLDYQAREAHTIVLSYVLRRLAVDTRHTYSREFHLVPGSRIVAVTLSPDSGHRLEDWILDYTLITVLKGL
ncbi:MAG: hypothetical protein RI947_1056 [Candidatus Parcubacteria bacterium]|jgi:hypothetical protein